jgi:diguanylate cyclase (GGDEF)-like protein
VAIKHSDKTVPKRRKSDTLESGILEVSRYYAATKRIVTTESTTDFLTESQLQPTTLNPQDLLISELNAARLLNLDMPDEPKQFIHLLEARIKEITGTRKNVILILDEDSGTYTCLNDEVSDDFSKSPRELTWISDTYLRDLLQSEQVMHSFLHYHGTVFGIIAIADKMDGSDLSLKDEILLEQLTQYLSVQVNHYLSLKRTMALPAIQQVLLHISNGLLCAVDSAEIFRDTLFALRHELPITAGQYIELDRKTGKGHVLYQLSEKGFEEGSPIRDVNQFVSLLSLFRSQVWKNPYLYLKGEMLGDKSFSELFGLPGISSVILLPMLAENNHLEGALVLFQQNEAITLSKDALKVLEQVSELVISACSRAKVLEKALEIATTDELTGAVNRRGFYSRLDGEVDRARRSQAPICLAMIDVDHFKMINDTYGHLVGDQILMQLAKQVRKNIRKSDIFCRFGGEEFTLVLPETTMSAGTELLERLRHKVEKMIFQTAAGPIKMTFSAGLDLVETTQGLSKDSMHIISESLTRADEALYQAKQFGRNRIIVVD